MIDKIVAGKVNKRLSEICLTSQLHVAEDGSPVIAKFLQSTASQLSSSNVSSIEIESFTRWMLGEQNINTTTPSA